MFLWLCSFLTESHSESVMWFLNNKPKSPISLCLTLWQYDFIFSPIALFFNHRQKYTTAMLTQAIGGLLIAKCNEHFLPHYRGWIFFFFACHCQHCFCLGCHNYSCGSILNCCGFPFSFSLFFFFVCLFISANKGRIILLQSELWLWQR